MGQEAHRKYKEFKKKEVEAKRFPSERNRQSARIAELEYRLQQRKDDDDFKRGYDLLTKYEY